MNGDAAFVFGYGLDGWPIGARDTNELLRDIDARRIGYDEIPLAGGSTAAVSTVFLVVDHAMGPGPPVLWETMVFFDETLEEDYCDRYTTRKAAQRGHRDVVQLLRSVGV